MSRVQSSALQVNDPALEPPPIRTAPGPEYADDTRIFQGIPGMPGIPGIERAANGRLWALWYAGGPDEPPDGKTRSHLIARLPGDDGRTWQGGLTIDERAGVSYPDGVQSPEGTIYLIYDFARQADKTIWMATFTEEDVLQGAWASDRARQRVLVNQATGRQRAS